MLKRTHLAIGTGLMLLFLPYVNYKLVFIPVILIVSLLPDIDSSSSYYGQNPIFRPLQFFVRHRGILHSFTFCILASIAFAFFIPVLAFPFFLGYAGHLFADSFTREGIVLFWPFRKTSSGILSTGGRIEYSVYVTIIIVDILLFVKLFL